MATKTTTTTATTTRNTNSRPSRSTTTTLHLNWSNFKPEISQKPHEDAEVHLLHLNDWVNAQYFVDDVKVQRFCLTLLGQVRL